MWLARTQAPEEQILRVPQRHAVDIAALNEQHALGLTALEDADGNGDDDSGSCASDLELGVGSVVVVVDLATAHLNDQYGVVCGPQRKSGRWPVMLDDELVSGGKPIGFKEENLLVLDSGAAISEDPGPAAAAFDGTSRADANANTHTNTNADASAAAAAAVRDAVPTQLNTDTSLDDAVEQPLDAAHPGTDVGTQRDAAPGPSTNPAANVCAVCGRSARQKCAGCGAASYCGKECQRQHWKRGGHRAQCQTLKAAAAAEAQARKLGDEGRRATGGCGGQNNPASSPSPTMACVACGVDKPAASFSNKQRKKPVGSRKCSACTSANGAAAAGSSGWVCETGRENLYDLGPGPADCTCTNTLQYPPYAPKCTSAAEGRARVGKRCRIRDTWASFPTAEDMARRLGVLGGEGGWVPDAPCSNGEEGVVVARGPTSACGHDAFGHRSFGMAVAVRVASQPGPASSVVLIDERAVQYLGARPKTLTGVADPDAPECSICLEDHCTDTVVLENCGHAFCYTCLHEHQSRSPGAVCPLCRDSMPDVTKDAVGAGTRWRVGERVHACFPNEDASKVIDVATGRPFESLGTVTGLPDGDFEPDTLLVTYDGHPPRLPRQTKMFCYGECYVPADFLRRVDPAVHRAFDAEAAARGDSFHRPAEPPAGCPVS